MAAIPRRLSQRGQADDGRSGFERVSALYGLGQQAMLRTSTQLSNWRRHGPGRDAASLAAIIRYNAPVVRVERQSSHFRVDYREGASVRSMMAERVLFAVPASTMRQIEMKPRLSREKDQAIPFWNAAGLSGSARTDQATEIWDAASGQTASSHGILGATAAGEMGLGALGMTPEASLSVGVDLVADAFPGIRFEFENGAAYRWCVERWMRGAFARYRPGQMTTMMPALASAEDGLHFGGEHTSAWTGWMEGALESGERAAREVLSAIGREWPEPAGATQ